MLEFFHNDYVIEIIRKADVEEYNFIATHSSWKKALGNLERSLRDRELDPNNAPARQQPQTQLFSEYATISRGQTSRVTFEVHMAEDLDKPKEKLPLWEQIKIGALAIFMIFWILGLLFCAFTGLAFLISTLLSWIWH